MEQLNNTPTATQEEQQGAVGLVNTEPALLDKVRRKFGVYGTISLIFAVAFTALFYKAWVGFNVFIFSAVMVVLLVCVMRNLSLEIKTGTWLYYSGVLLLGLSTFLTSSDTLQFLNVVGILFLLDLSLLHQFHKDREWEFVKHLGKMLGMVFYAIAAIAMPIVDGVNHLKTIRIFKNDKARNVILGFVVSIPLLIIVTALLSKADLIFGELADTVFGTFFSEDVILLGLMLIFGFFACYCILGGVLLQLRQEKKCTFTKANPTIAVTTMAMLCLIYALFCIIQLIYLFANGLSSLPAQYTFAEYARRGFFELLAVTIINITLMILCNTLFGESRILRFLVTIMTACTYVMIASATYRMLLYIGAYQLTFLRLFVLLALLIDALVLAGIIISQYKNDFPLFTYCVAVISVCYIAFSLSKPDYYIADYLSEQKEVLNSGDLNFLTMELSLDAAPVVIPLLQEEERWLEADKTGKYTRYDYKSFDSMKNDYYTKITDADKESGIRGFDIAYKKAADMAKRYPLNQ